MGLGLSLAPKGFILLSLKEKALPGNMVTKNVRALEMSGRAIVFFSEYWEIVRSSSYNIPIPRLAGLRGGQLNVREG